MTPFTYHPILYWRCTKCQKKGEITHALDEGVTERYERVLEAHRTLSPLCAEAYGDRGIAVESDQGHFPEAS